MPDITFLRELEADLRAIAERDALRVPQRRTRRRVGLATALGALLAAVAAFAVIGNPLGGAGSRIDAAAAAAVAPPDLIEHTVELTRQVENGRTVTVRQERWVATDSPSTWREISDDPADGGPIEQAESPTTVSSYDATGAVIYERTKPANWKGLDHSMAIDDMNAVSRMLAYDDARDTGKTALDGQTVERFDFGSRDTNGQACSYYATASDLRPVALDCTNLLGHPWLSSHTTYEWLDPTPANSALLSLEGVHPDTRIDSSPLGECIQGQDYFGPTDPRNAPCAVNAPNG